MSEGDRDDRTARLTAAAAARTTSATARARRAITRLHNTGQSVTFVAVAALSILSALMPAWVDFSTLNPAFGAILFGMLNALGDSLQIIGVGVRTEFIGMFPYIGIMIAMIVLARRTSVPAAHRSPRASTASAESPVGQMATVRASLLGTAGVNPRLPVPTTVSSEPAGVTRITRFASTK